MIFQIFAYPFIKLLMLDRWHAHLNSGGAVWRRFDLENWRWEYRDMTDDERKDEIDAWHIK